MFRLKSILKIASVFIGLAIAYLSLRPTIHIGEVNDKVGHFIAYFTLMFVMGLGFWKKKKELLMAFVTSAIYGVLMEIGQYFVPGRSFSFLDMLANASGALLAIGFLLLFGKNIIHLLRIK